MESLQALCLQLVAENMESFCHKSKDGELRLQHDLYLPSQICDSLLQRRRNFGLTKELLSIFKDPSVTRLDNVDFSYMKQFNEINARSYLKCSETETHPLENHLVDIVKHDLSELNLLGVRLTRNIIDALSQHCHRLRGLHLKASSFNCHCARNRDKGESSTSFQCCLKDFKPDLQRLQRLSLHEAGSDFFDIAPPSSQIAMQMITSAKHLTILDLSKSLLLNLEFLKPEQFPSLHSLILFEVRVRQSRREETALASPEFQVISALKTLRRLDVSRICEYAADAYTNPDTQKAFETMIANLPNLEFLDISGTAFAGDGDSITWLEGRTLTFLGLLDCKNKPSPCKRANLPAERVTGNANIEQILTCLQMYAGRAWLPHVFEPLKALIHHLLPPNQRLSKQVLLRANRVVVEVMEKNLHEGQILAAGCTCLTVLLGSVGSLTIDIPTKRHIIRLILDIILTNTNLKLLRCAADVLDRFKWPKDGYFIFEKLVSAMLRMLRLALRREHELVEHNYMMSQLENIASPINPRHKAIVGRLGGIKLLNQVVAIEVKKKNGEHHAPLSIAWQLLYSLSDETPDNCRLFVQEKGIELFAVCHKVIKNEHVIVDMMGILCNTAEVSDLRPHIMKSPEVMDSLISTMRRGYFEKRNSAVCALSHLIADGEENWTYAKYSLKEVDKMIENEVIEGWSDKKTRMVEYRTLVPLVRLLECSECCGVQTYGSWEIMTVLAGKPHIYAPMLERDGVLTALRIVVEKLNNPYEERVQYGQKIISLHEAYKLRKEATDKKSSKKLNLADLEGSVNGQLHDTSDDDSDYQPHISDSEDGGDSDIDDDDGDDDDDDDDDDPNHHHHNALIDMLEGNLIQQAVDELEEYRPVDFEDDLDIDEDANEEVVVPDADTILLQRQQDYHGSSFHELLEMFSDDSSDEYPSDQENFICGLPLDGGVPMEDDPDYLP